MLNAARDIELLAPARDPEIARQAILHGADAVYIGGPSHGARAAASNSIADIAGVVEMAHLYGVKVYVTLNTIIYDHELQQVQSTIRQLYDIGVDALIIQDMSILRMDIPPIDLHASTQCDIRTPAKARFLGECGFSQLVLPRELSLAEIREMREHLDAYAPSTVAPGGRDTSEVRLEAFVHGALCVSYSGDCQASCVSCGRSANRGECAQMCRMAYSLIDGDGREVVRDKHLLSLRDLNRLDDVGDLIDAGVSSLKIEGRLKDAAYVKTVVSAYRRAIDQVIARSGGRYRRASYGHTTYSPDFLPVTVEDVFNRGFTRYFIDGRPKDQATGTVPVQRPTGGRAVPGPSNEAILHGGSMICADSPKWTGRQVGVVTSCKGRMLTARLHWADGRPEDGPHLHNGDGLGYYDSEGRFNGFRLNRIDGDRLYAATPVDIPPGTPLYRNRDTRLDAILAQETAKRLIDISMTLSTESLENPRERSKTLENPRESLAESGSQASQATLRLSLTAENGVSVEVAAEVTLDRARTPQKEARAKALSKLGTTPYSLTALDDRLDEWTFVPASQLTALRQQATETLTKKITACYQRRQRLPEDPAALPPSACLTYHDNVANHLADTFYRSHGVTSIDPAIELSASSVPASLSHGARRVSAEDEPLVVMTTRYCLRRELGACLLTPEGRRLKGPLRLKNDAATFRLDFDCRNCQMKVIKDRPRLHV